MNPSETAADADPQGTTHPRGTGAPAPFDDVDALEALEEELTTLAAQIAAADSRFLRLLADFDRRRGWELGGHRSCVEWLHFRTGMDRGTAREKLRTARALPTLPRIAEAMARGRLSFSAVRCLTRAATPECEEELLEVAMSYPTAELERFVRAWRRESRASEAALERERFRSRRLCVFPDEEGMYEVKGKVPAEVGALLQRGLEAAVDALFRAEAREETTPKQRRADALALLVERALVAGFGGGAGGGGEGEHGNGSREGSPDAGEGNGVSGSVSAETPCTCPHENGASPHRNGSAPAPAPVTGSRAERYQVFLHLDVDTLRKGGEPGRSELEDGTRLSAETARRIACDAALVPVLRDEHGDVLDLGRRRRTVSPALRRALEIRDRGCRFPGCGLRFTQPHHVEHWSDGGRTRKDNLILLCGFHHWKVHEGGWDVVLNRADATAVFLDPRGRMRASRRPRPPEVGETAPDDLVADNRRRGADPGGWDLSPRYARPSLAPCDLEIRALCALDEAHFGVGSGGIRAPAEG